MKSNIDITTRVTLELTAQEADWLHAVVQNPLDYNVEPVGETEESELDQEMRGRFFHATHIPCR